MSQADTLDSAGYAAVLSMLERAAAASDRAGFGLAVCEDIYAIFSPCVSVSYTESSDDASRAAAVIIPRPEQAWFETYQAVYETYMMQNPLLALAVAGGGRLERATAWTDADASGAFADSDLYQHFYAPNGIHSQIAITVPVEHGGVAGVAINRDGTGFDARERALLNAASPLLGWAHRHVTEHAAPLVRPAGVEWGESWLFEDDASRGMRERLLTAGLTARQTDVVLHVATGATNRQIGRALGISPETVRKHLENAYVTLGVTNRVAAAAIALGASMTPA